jgi:hypothetical protein
MTLIHLGPHFKFLMASNLAANAFDDKHMIRAHIFDHDTTAETRNPLLQYEQGSRHAHIVYPERAAPKSGKVPCGRCLMSKTLANLAAMESTFLEALEGIKKPHDDSAAACKCYTCTGMAMGALSRQAREFVAQMTDVLKFAEDKMDAAGETMDDQADEIHELRHVIAKLSADQLLLEEKKEPRKDAPKTKKNRARKERQKAKAKDEQDRKLVPVFGDAPLVSGGAFAALSEVVPQLEPDLVPVVNKEKSELQDQSNIVDNDGNPFCVWMV